MRLPLSSTEVRRLGSRDRRTWEALVEAQYARLYNLHLRLGAPPETAADLTQESFEAAWKAAPRYQGRSRPEVWLYGVALNVHRNWRRHAGGEDPVEGPPEGDWPDPEPTAEELAVLHERQEQVAGAVARLPEALRRTVVLRYFLGVTAVEIARDEGVAASTVRGRLHEALKRLWVMLQPTLGKELEEDGPQAGALRIAP